jgi:hypothetical protein
MSEEEAFEALKRVWATHILVEASLELAAQIEKTKEWLLRNDKLTLARFSGMAAEELVMTMEDVICDHGYPYRFESCETTMRAAEDFIAAARECAEELKALERSGDGYGGGEG